MPITIISQNQDEKELENSISSFFSKHKLGDLLKRCNARKEKGVPVLDIFKYKMTNVFAKKSMYMQMKTDSFKESFSKNTFYRFLENTKTNWLKFTSLLSKSVIDSIEPLTDENRINAFIVDDSLFERTSCKATELGSKVFDHCSMKYKKGFRLMTLGWTDGNTFVPVNSCLLASSKEKNIIGTTKAFDKRTLASKRRILATSKGTDAMIELIKTAQKSGHTADYVLFDTWFSNPAQLISIKKLGLDSIAMIKKTPKVFYEYNGEKMNLKQIYGVCKKNRGRSKILLSVNVTIGDSIPAKIVCVRNKNNKKDWIAFISTNTKLSDEEIIRIYGKRWQIEVFFKVCKSQLNLVGECRSLSYDALTAHVAIVFARYMMVALEQRKSKDQRTLGEIFFYFVDELCDITFKEALNTLLNAMTKSICKLFHLIEDQIVDWFNDFLSNLPTFIQNALTGITIEC